MENYSKPGGQNVDILNSIINNTEYSEEPRSQISELLLELKEVIESGGGTSAETAALLIDNAAKNLLPITLDRVKKANEGAAGTWSDNVYTENGITFTVSTDDAGRGTGVTVAQTAGAASASLNLVPVDVELVDDEPVFIYDPTYSAGDYIISIGCELPTGVDLGILYNGNTQQYIHEDTTVTLTEGSEFTAWIYVRSNDVESGDPVIFDSFTVRPMLRRAAVTDGTFEVGYMTQKQLDAAVRELQKSGGGGSAYTETVLWTNTNMTSGWNVPFTLSSAANLFDTIIYYLALTSNGVIETHMPVYCPVSLVTDKISAEYNNNRFFDSVINAQYTGGEFSASGDCTLHKIIGINYGEHVADFEEEVFPNG